MKLALVKNLNNTETLAKDIISCTGKVLLKKGILLSTNIVNKLVSQGIFFVYIKADELDDISSNEDKLIDLKKSTLESIPNMFNDLITCNEKSLNYSLGIVDDLVSHIQSDNSMSLNLYEVKTYDNYTYIHSVDTSIMSIFLGSNMNLSTQDLRSLAISSMFHDIGKTKISNKIVNKPEKLTRNEFDQMKLHPFFGKEILSKVSSIPQSVIDGVAQHHEKFDGTGYPFNMKSNNICLLARIISICDVFTAITADRVYRKKFNPKEAYEYILSQSYSSFDPDIVQVFKNTFAIYPIGCHVLLSNGLKGYIVRQNQQLPDRPVIRIFTDKYENKIPIYDLDLKTNLNITVVNTIN